MRQVGYTFYYEIRLLHEIFRAAFYFVSGSWSERLEAIALFSMRRRLPSSTSIDTVVSWISTILPWMPPMVTTRWPFCRLSLLFLAPLHLRTDHEEIENDQDDYDQQDLLQGGVLALSGSRRLQQDVQKIHVFKKLFNEGAKIRRGVLSAKSWL